MKSGEIKNFIYMPCIGWIEAGATPDDAMERIELAEVELAIEDMRILKKLKKRFPHARIHKAGTSWIVEQNDEPE